LKIQGKYKMKNWNRNNWVWLYILIGVVINIILVILQLRHQKVFCDESAMTGYSYFFRFLWCLSFVCFGFATIAFYWRKNEGSPWPKYATQYPLQILITASMVSGLLHFWERTSGYPFYYLSSSTCFILGFLVDYHWHLVRLLIDKVKNS
jgi:hypothetical protein